MCSFKRLATAEDYTNYCVIELLKTVKLLFSNADSTQAIRTFDIQLSPLFQLAKFCTSTKRMVLIWSLRGNPRAERSTWGDYFRFIFIKRENVTGTSHKGDYMNN